MNKPIRTPYGPNIDMAYEVCVELITGGGFPGSSESLKRALTMAKIVVATGGKVKVKV